MQPKYMAFIKFLVATSWAWLWSFILPVQQFLAFTFVLVVCDFLSGIAAAKQRGEKLQSRGFARTVTKIALYCMAILLSHGMDRVFFAPAGLSFGLVWMVAAFIGLTEFKSNLENIRTVTGADIWGKIAGVMPDIFKLPKRDPKQKKDDA